MPDAPRLILQTIAPQESGWDSQLQTDMELIEQRLRLQPSQAIRVYRVSSSNPDETKFLNLVDFSPVGYQGCFVWVQDPGGTGWTTTIKDPVDGTTDITHKNQYAFSDGVDWVWSFRPNTNVAGIT